jgi:hypothetical protein
VRLPAIQNPRGTTWPKNETPTRSVVHYAQWGLVGGPSLGNETDPEEFLVHATVFVASEMKRAKSAYLECAQPRFKGSQKGLPRAGADVKPVKKRQTNPTRVMTCA